MSPLTCECVHWTTDRFIQLSQTVIGLQQQQERRGHILEEVVDLGQISLSIILHSLRLDLRPFILQSVKRN